MHRFKRYYKGDTSERLKCSAFANENQNEKSKKITDKHNFVLKIFILFFCKSIEFLSTIRSHVWPLPLEIFLAESYISMVRQFLKFEKNMKESLLICATVRFNYQRFFKKYEKFFYRLKEKRDWNNRRIVVTLTHCWQCAAK